MKTWKLVSGIISIVLSVFVVFQSMIAGLAHALEESGQVSGSAGLVVSICMLCGGIVSIVSRKNNSKGTNIALLILFSLATLTGFVLAENYSDLYIITHSLFYTFFLKHKKRQQLSCLSYHITSDVF